MPTDIDSQVLTKPKKPPQLGAPYLIGARFCQIPQIQPDSDNWADDPSIPSDDSSQNLSKMTPYRNAINDTLEWITINQSTKARLW